MPKLQDRFDKVGLDFFNLREKEDCGRMRPVWKGPPKKQLASVKIFCSFSCRDLEGNMELEAEE